MSTAKILILLLLENFIIVPLNAEFLLISAIKDKPKKKYFFAYVITNTIGGCMGFLMGSVFSSHSLTFLKSASNILFNNDSTFTDSILIADPSNILLFKSLMPGIPISVLNITCGIFGTELNRFIAITVCFRVVRFLILNLLKDFIKIRFLKDLFIGLISISISYMSLAIMHKVVK